MIYDIGNNKYGKFHISSVWSQTSRQTRHLFLVYRYCIFVSQFYYAGGCTGVRLSAGVRTYCVSAIFLFLLRRRTCESASLDANRRPVRMLNPMSDKTK